MGFYDAGKALWIGSLTLAALGVNDGGVVTTEFLCVYFDRFHIDPIDHETGYDPL